MHRPVKAKELRQDIWSIQYLRAIAAIAVVLFHELQGIHPIFRLGEHGVDLFFVISGFIMVALTDGRKISPARFLLDRLARIAPPYWIATILVFLLVLMHVDFYSGSSDLTLLIKSLVFVPSDNGHGRVWPTLFLGWTLNFEMFFYVAFACALLIEPRVRLLCLTVVFILLIALGTLFAHGNAISTTYTSPLLAEFISGAWLGRIYGLRLNNQRFWPALSYCFSILSLLAAMSLMFPSLIFGCGAVFLVSAGLALERLERLPKIPLLKFLGDASFAIYLFQQFAFLAVDVSRPWLDRSIGALVHGHAPSRLLSIIAALALGPLVFVTVERPLTRAVRQLLTRVTHVPVRIGQAP